MNITDRPQCLAFRPARSLVTASHEDWVINNIGVVSFIHEDLLAGAYADDRRKAGRKIRQQRRKLRRVNAEFGHGRDEGVPASILRSKVVII